MFLFNKKWDDVENKLKILGYWGLRVVCLQKTLGSTMVIFIEQFVDGLFLSLEDGCRINNHMK